MKKAQEGMKRHMGLEVRRGPLQFVLLGENALPAPASAVLPYAAVKARDAVRTGRSQAAARGPVWANMRAALTRFSGLAGSLRDGLGRPRRTSSRLAPLFQVSATPRQEAMGGFVYMACGIGADEGESVSFTEYLMNGESALERSQPSRVADCSSARVDVSTTRKRTSSLMLFFRADVSMDGMLNRTAAEFDRAGRAAWCSHACPSARVAAAKSPEHAQPVRRLLADGL